MHQANLDETINALQGIVDGDKRSIISCVHLGTILDSLFLLNEYKQKRTPVEMEIEGGGLTWWYVCPECHGICD